ncbi:beta-glucosidase [Vallitalea longa]|uniref:Beta-glucosidase n=1 Tax=Vallitalea longa TaxID=2936439 RepID=A0A9W5YDF5_9FIRM|nr:glycoside hydrolase family 3 N-terminal domain-containing protein [Vallitalea longa]GKX31452.1 beta-glucosidase [Vallitalea longa]
MKNTSINEKKIYKNTELPISERVKDLMKRMTLEEKIAQTISIDTTTLLIDENEETELFESGQIQNEKLKDLLVNGIGAFQLPGKHMSPEKSAVYRNILQKHIIDHTRLQIPVLSQEECLMGQLSKDSTMFPRPIGLAGTFDTELVEEIYTAIGKETNSRGGHQAFTPVLDIGRDPRWGRYEETFGEDTYLVSRMAVSVVKGLQGGSQGVEKGHIISSPKHFAGYGQCAGGRNFAPTDIPLRMFRDEILPPFKAAVMEAGAKGIMPSHSEIDGIPCHANKWLLTNVLRDEWGFDGIVISDYNDASRLDLLHHVSKDVEEAAVCALSAGLDMDIPSGSAFNSLLSAAKKSEEVVKLINQAVSRILKVKFELGLFENVYADPDEAKTLVNSKAHKTLAKKAADKTIILLKNENDLLPIEQKNIKSIAVIGPNADPVEFSYYSTRPNIGTSILNGIVGKVGNQCKVLYEKGCHITKSVKVIETETNVVSKNPTLYTLDEEIEEMKKAVEAAKKSDVAIVCIGGSPSSSREAVTLQKHYGDSATLDIVGQQNKLLEMLLETGTPTIVVLINGKPLSCGFVYDNAPAILEGWYLGQETGNAVADVLFGDVNPGGKLPVTLARSAGHLPAYYSQKPSGFLKDYLFEIEGPYFCFGHGLSYTTFEYEGLALSKSVIKIGDSVEVSVNVSNTGDRVGDEVVQMYIRDNVASVTRPKMLLKGFKRITLSPGDTKKVKFEITPDKIEFTGIDYKPTIEAGTFNIMVGTSSKKFDTVVLTVIE